MALTACGDGGLGDTDGGAGGTGGAGGSGASCPVDDSRDIDSAFTAPFGTTVTEKICPIADQDYWRVTTTGPNKIVSLDLRLQALSNIRLQAEWHGPQGVCVTSPVVSCTPTGGECGAGASCDSLRGVCKATDALPCVGSAGCGAGTECSEVLAPLQVVTEEPNVGGTLHLLQANFPAPVQGDYVVRVHSTELVAVTDAEYQLTLTETDDPDPHEPNNAQNLAAVLKPGATVEGYLAYVGDEDWFHVTHEANGAPVVTVELQWPTGLDIAPSWTVCAPTCDVSAPPAKVEGTTWVRRSRFVSAPGTELWVRVKDGPTQSRAFDPQKPYTLTVRVDEDPTEPTRNDTPDTATPIALGTPSANPTPVSFVNSLVAVNDQDWYALQRDAAVSVNSLVKVRAVSSAPEDSNFLMQLTFYRKCGAGSAFTCPPGAVTLSGGMQIAPYFVWPSIDSIVLDPATGEGAFELGGHTPNHLEVMVPLFAEGDGGYFVAVTHVTATPLNIGGYTPPGVTCVTGAEPGCYTLELAHYAEPDPGDLHTPDNVFVSRPLAPQLRRDDFVNQPRTLAATAGGITQWTITDPPGVAGFATADTGQFVEASSCGPISFYVADGKGQPAASATLSALSASSGSFVTDCDTLTPVALPLELTEATPTLFYNAASVGDVTISSTIQGESALTSGITVAATGSTPALTTVSGLLGAAPPAGFVVNGSSGGLTVRLTPGPSTGTPLELQVQGSGNPVVACRASQQGVCFGLDAIPAAERCNGFLSVADGGKSACQILVGAGGTFDVVVNTDAAGPVTLVVTDPAGNYAPAYFTATAYPPATFEFGNGAGTMFYASGYISYAGDQDFFTIPISSFPTRVGMTVNLRVTGPSPVDFRVTATRGNGGVSVELGGSDLCRDCPGSCNSRGYCDQAAADLTVGANEGDCAFLVDGGDLEIWVNDTLSNEWDLEQPYEVAVWLTEGCPSSCDAFVCGQ